MRRTMCENQEQGNSVSWLLVKSFDIWITYDEKHPLKEGKEQVLIFLYRRERRSDRVYSILLGKFSF